MRVRVRSMVTAFVVAMAMLFGIGAVAAAPASAASNRKVAVKSVAVKQFRPTRGYHDYGPFEGRLATARVHLEVVPAYYVHYSWSYQWKVKRVAEGWGAGPTAAANLLCAKLPVWQARVACTVLVQLTYSSIKWRINKAIEHHRCIAARFIIDPRMYAQAVGSKSYTTKCYK